MEDVKQERGGGGEEGLSIRCLSSHLLIAAGPLPPSLLLPFPPKHDVSKLFSLKTNEKNVKGEGGGGAVKQIARFFYVPSFDDLSIPLCSTGGHSDEIPIPKLIEFLNEKQRDPRLNEILYPHYNEHRAREIISNYEPEPEVVKRGERKGKTPSANVSSFASLGQRMIGKICGDGVG